jgi:hypothetical protein
VFGQSIGHNVQLRANLVQRKKNEVIFENVLNLVHFSISPCVCMFSCVMRVEVSKPKKDKRKSCFCVFV